MSVEPVIDRQFTEQSVPVFSQSVTALNDALSGTVLNWKTVGDIILRDPGLVLQTMRFLKGGSKRMGTLEVTDMSQAVMLLGVSRMKQLVENLPVLEKTLSGDALRKYCKAVNRGYHAAVHARNWAQWRNDFAPEEIYIATLLHNIPELVLWINEPEKMHELRLRVYREKMSPDEAHHITLGNSLQHYGRMVTSSLDLPEFVNDVFRPENSDQPRVKQVLLAVQLANMVEFGWYSDTVADILEQVAVSVNKTPEEITKIVHANSVESANNMPFPAETAAAALLIQLSGNEVGLIAEEFPETISARQEISEEAQKQPKLANVTTGSASDNKDQDDAGVTRAGQGSISVSAASQQKQKRPVVELVAEPGKPSAAVCFNPQSALFSDAVKKLEQGRGKDKASEILRCAVHGMHDGAGFHRVVFATKSSKGDFLEARFLVGSDNDPAFNKFQIKLDNINLFSRLLAKPSALWVNDENRSKYWKSVPDVFKVIIKTDSFCAMSVHVDSSPVGLFYADRHSPDCKIDKQAFTMFRHLGQLAAKSLAARRRAK